MDDNKNSVAKMIKEIYGPVIKAELEHSIRMDAIFTIASIKDVVGRLVRFNCKRHFFMSKEDKFLIKQATATLVAYDVLFPRHNIDGSVTFKMRVNPE